MKRTITAIAAIALTGILVGCSVGSSPLPKATSSSSATATPNPHGDLTFAAGRSISGESHPQFWSKLIGNPEQWTVVSVAAGIWTCTSTTNGTVVTIRQPQIGRGTGGVPKSADDRSATIQLLEQMYPRAKNLKSVLVPQEFTYVSVGSDRTVDTLAAYGGSKSTGFYVTFARVFNRVGYAVILDILATSEENRSTDTSFVITNTAITLK